MLDSLRRCRAFSTVFDRAPLGVCVLDLEGRIEDANATLTRMLGFPELEARVITTDLTHPRDVDASRSLYRDLASGERDSFSLEKRYVSADGSTVYGRGTALLVRDAGGSPDFVVGLIEPRDELVQLREDVAGARAAAHDLNNLLTVIFAHQQRLLGTLPPNDESRAAAEGIGGAAGMFVPILRSILSLSTRQPELVDVNQLILGMRSVAARLVGAKVKIVLRLDPATPPVWIERAGLERAITNIAANARDAMPDGGTFLVETAATVGFVKIHMTDTGVGIHPRHLPRVLERDFTTKEDGSGIGLAVTREVVESAGGHVGVASALGQGTTVTLALRSHPIDRVRPV